MKKFKFLAIILTLILAASTLTGCKPNIKDYQNDKIKIVGLTEEPFYITPLELSKMEIVEATAVGKSDKAGTVKTYGPSLETFLAKYDYTLDDVYSMKLIAGDNYKVTLAKTTWDKYQVVFSIGNGWRSLKKDQRPMRVVIPGADSGKWVRNIVEIDFTLNQ